MTRRPPIEPAPQYELGGPAQRTLDGRWEPVLGYHAAPDEPSTPALDDDDRQLGLFAKTQLELRTLWEEVNGTKERLRHAPFAPHLQLTTAELCELAELVLAEDRELRRALWPLDVCEGPIAFVMGLSAFLGHPLKIEGGMYDANGTKRDHGGNGWGRLAAILRHYPEPYTSRHVRNVWRRRWLYWMPDAGWHEGEFVQKRKRKDGTDYDSTGRIYPHYCGRTVRYLPAVLYRAGYRSNVVRLVVRALYRVRTNTRAWRIVQSLRKVARQLERTEDCPPYLESIAWSRTEADGIRAMTGRRSPPSRSLSKYAGSRDFIAKKNPSLTGGINLGQSHPAGATSGADRSSQASGPPRSGSGGAVDLRLSPGRRGVTRSRAHDADAAHDSGPPARSPNSARRGGARSETAENTTAGGPRRPQARRSHAGWCDDHPELEPALCAICGDPFACPRCIRLRGCQRCDACRADGAWPEAPERWLNRLEWIALQKDLARRSWEQIVAQKRRRDEAQSQQTVGAVDVARVRAEIRHKLGLQSRGRPHDT